MYHRSTFYRLKRILATGLLLWWGVLSPLLVSAEVGSETEAATTEVAAQTCSGAGCGQGENQGDGQGAIVETSATNSDTGADSTNTSNVDVSDAMANTINNEVTDTTTATATATTGDNANSSNTGSVGVDTGNAGISTTQVKNDNTAVVNGTAGLTVTGEAGDHNGDLNLGVGSGTASLNDPENSSVQVSNELTGNGSDNSATVETSTQQVDEIQNDGRIDNTVDLSAITGRNQAEKNTGDAVINTGDASVAATLVNLLNNTVVDGNLWVTVADIFGDLNGNIVIPDLASLLPTPVGTQTSVEAANVDTGAYSQNEVDVTTHDLDRTRVNNDANIETTVNADAITGGNVADANTGGAVIKTGDASVEANNITVANTTINGGNWVLAIVNALNGWFGYLVGDNGEVRQLTPEETIRQVEANNAATGVGSDNVVTVDENRTNDLTVNNDAVINNTVNAKAITGENDASKNTGTAEITTGDASIRANTVNIANTTVKNGSLLVAVVNVLGDWVGDLLFGGKAIAHSGDGGIATAVEATNADTGSHSDNEINVETDYRQEVDIDNDANVRTALNANVNTGDNRANRNTMGALIETGIGSLMLHSGTAANLVGIADGDDTAVTVDGANSLTGADSANDIHAAVTDQRIVNINNKADVRTMLNGLVNTGRNEASENTMGGMIRTGLALADVAIHNLLNKVLFASGDDVTDIEVVLVNEDTGFDSDNHNDVSVSRERVANIINNANIENLVNLALNTGVNVASANTDGAGIETGAICVEGNIENVVNEVGVGAGSLVLTNEANVVDGVHIAGNTGGNILERNTRGVGVVHQVICPVKEEVIVIEDVVEEVVEEVEEVEESIEEECVGEWCYGEVLGAVAPAMVPAAAVPTALEQFPVAGGVDKSILREAPTSKMWAWLDGAGVVIVMLVWLLDRRAARTRGVDY